MKNIYYIFIAIIILSSCSNSDEDLINSNIKKIYISSFNNSDEDDYFRLSNLEDGTTYIMGEFRDAPDFETSMKLSEDTEVHNYAMIGGTPELSEDNLISSGTIGECSFISLDIPGEIHILTVAKLKAGKVEYWSRLKEEEKIENEIVVNVEFPEALEIFFANQLDIDYLWQENLRNAEYNASQGFSQELGFWIYATAHDGYLYYTTGEIEYGPKFYSIDDYESIEPKSPQKINCSWKELIYQTETTNYPVAYVVAHAPIRYLPDKSIGQAASRDAGVSYEDRNLERELGVPVLVYDYATSEITNEDDLNGSAQVGFASSFDYKRKIPGSLEDITKFKQ